MFQSIPTGVYRASSDGILLSVNEAFVQLLGYSEEELRGRKLIELCVDTTDPRRWSNPDSDQIQNQEIVLRNKEGEHITLLENAHVTRDSTGNVLYYEGVLTDITERKHAERAFHESIQFAEEVISGAGEGIVVYDRDLRYVVWNSFMQQLTGLPFEDVVGKYAPELFPHIVESGIEDLLRRALQGEHTKTNDVYYYVKSTGKTGWVVGSYGPHRDSHGEIAGVIGIIHEITDRKRAELALRESEDNWRSLVENAPNTIMTIDRQHRIQFINRVVPGLDKDQVIGSQVYDYVPPQERDRLQRVLTRILETAQPDSYEITSVGPNGSTAWYKVSAGAVLHDGKAESVVLIATDITERKQAELLQSALYRIAAESSSAKDLQELYSAIHQIVGELMYAKNFYIALYDEQNRMLSFPYFVDELDEAPLYVPLGKGLTEFILQTNEPLLASRETYERMLQDGKIEAIGPPPVDWLGAPLRSGSQTFGVLVVQSYTERVRFGEREKEVLTFVSRHIATSLQRKQAEAALRASEERLRLLVEKMPAILWTTDNDLKFTSAVGAAMKSLNLTSAQLIGVAVPNYFQTPEPESAVAGGHQKALKGESASFELDWLGRTFQCHVEPLRIHDAIIGTIGIALDITERKYAEAGLEESLSLLRATLESTADGILVVDGHGRITSYNRRFLEMWRIPDSIIASRDDSQAISFVLNQLTNPQEFLDKVEELYISPNLESYDILNFKDGRIFERYSRPQRIGGRSVGRVWSFRDVTEQKRAQEALRESAERYALAAQGANDGLWDWDLISERIYFSPRWKAMLGYESEIGDSPQDWFQRVHPDDLGRLRSEIKAHVDGATPHFQNEYRILHRDGTYRWMLARGIAVGEIGKRPYRIAGSQTDVTDRRIAEERLLHEAIHDVLTGLPNRALFMDLLARSLGRSKRHEKYMFGVLFLDLDRFKVINDSLGHVIGDQLLISLARRLEACLRPGDTVARLGGDEFTILIDDIKDISDATRVADRIQKELSHPFNLGGHEIFTSVSIGIALSVTGYDRPEDLIRDADTAMYRAKALGKARHQVFDSAMHSRAVALLQLENDLRRAIERREFLLYYQPTVSLITGEITGLEALIRWQHPERGLILPSEFISHAEETGLIIPIGNWVLREACKQMTKWQMHCGVPLNISVNLSARQFAQSDLIDQVSSILEETGLDANRLILEITESMLIENPEAATAMLQQLKALHVQLHVDDFGTGYSSLSYLHRFPIDTLKIDRSFVSRIGTNGENTEIVRAIIMLARNLGIDVIAEGVETIDQVSRLRTMDCHLAQGFHFSRPVPPENLSPYLSGTKWNVWAAN